MHRAFVDLFTVIMKLINLYKTNRFDYSLFIYVQTVNPISLFLIFYFFIFESFAKPISFLSILQFLEAHFVKFDGLVDTQ